MDGTEHDERRRRLQRIAYGADASPEEREAAEAELQQLPDAAASARPAADVDEPPGVRPGGSASPSAEDGDATAPAARRPTPSVVRWAVGAGVAALVVGVVAGVALGSQVSALASADPADPADPLAPGVVHADGATMPGATVSVDPGTGTVSSGSTPVELTPAYAVFEREPQASDTVGSDIVAGVGIDPASPRLLLTRSDGVALFAATKGDGTELCLVVTVPDSGAGATCTDDGLLPPDGLLLNVGMEMMPPITASLRVDGTAGLSVAELPADG